MSIIFNILIDGISYGMILFMISVGLSVTMGLMKVINLAHGGFALLGGAFTHWLTVQAELNFLPAVAIAILGVVIIAIIMEFSLFRRIYKFGELEQVLATIGIAFLVIASVNYWLGSTLLAIKFPEYLSGSINLGFRTLPVHRVFVILIGIVVVVALYILIERTRFGVNLRAAVDNRDMAASLGIDTARIYAITFGLGAGLAAFGGILGAELLPIEAYYPLRYMVLFLIVVAVGGMGSILGSFLAAISLGILDTAARYLMPDFSTIIFFSAMMLIFIIRPHGLLGKS